MLLSHDDYLKLAGHALAEQIIPQLPEGSAKALAGVVSGALAELRKRDRELPGLREKLAPDARALLARLEKIGPIAPDRERIDAMAVLLDPPVSAEAWQALLALLDEAARALLGSGTPMAAEWLRDAAELELAYYQGFADAGEPEAAGMEPQYQPLTREKLQAHLRVQLPDRPDLEVSELLPIHGGFMNETYFFTLLSPGRAPEELVVRKNAPWPTFTHWAHDAAEEFRILSIVSEAGLPVPRPLWLFADMPDVDGTYYVMTRARGHMVGSLAGAHAKLPERLLLSLADFLARLHAIPFERFTDYLETGKLPTRPGDTVSEAVRRNLDSMRTVWEQGPRLPSPGEAFTLDWLLRNVPVNGNPPSVVHTDCFVHNFLVVDDEIDMVVDWEASHIGDPAEDLAYVKDQVSQHMDWGKFIAHYRACGGPNTDETTLDYYKCLLNFRNYMGTTRASTWPTPPGSTSILSPPPGRTLPLIRSPVTVPPRTT